MAAAVAICVRVCCLLYVTVVVCLCSTTVTVQKMPRKKRKCWIDLEALHCSTAGTRARVLNIHRVSLRSS